jgi:hypothetical protein
LKCTRSQVHDPRGRRQTPSRVPSARQGRTRGHRTRAPCHEGGAFFVGGSTRLRLPHTYPPLKSVRSSPRRSVRRGGVPMPPRTERSPGTSWRAPGSTGKSGPCGHRAFPVVAPYHRAMAAGLGSSGPEADRRSVVSLNREARRVSELWTWRIAGRHQIGNGDDGVAGGWVGDCSQLSGKAHGTFMSISDPRIDLVALGPVWCGGSGRVEDERDDRRLVALRAPSTWAASPKSPPRTC